MICQQCYTINEGDSKFCKECGTSLSGTFVTRSRLRKKDKFILLTYVAFMVVVRIFYAFILKWVQPEMIATEPEKLMNFYKISDWVCSTIDVILLAFMLLIFEGKARIIFILLFVLRIIIYVAYFFF